MVRVEKGERGDRLRQARKDLNLSVAQVAKRVGYSESAVRALENGQNDLRAEVAEMFAPTLQVSAGWLLTGEGSGAAKMSPIIGRVGADNDGTVFLSSGQARPDFAPVPPGGSIRAVALDVVGHSMRGLADEGALIYFEDQRTPPTADMLGHVVVLETEDGRVLVKRLLRGSEKNLWDLESLSGPTLPDIRIRWAAHITAIIPPFMARRIAKRSGEAA